MFIARHRYLVAHKVRGLSFHPLRSLHSIRPAAMATTPNDPGLATPDGPSKSAGEHTCHTTGLTSDRLSIPAKKEAKRLEKEAKLAAKHVKQAANTPAGEKKAKAEKEKKEQEPAFVNTTPKGEKKGAISSPSFLLRNNAPQTCLSPWQVGTIQLRSNLLGTTGGRPRASSSLRPRRMAQPKKRAPLWFQCLPRTSPEPCISAMH